MPLIRYIDYLTPWIFASSVLFILLYASGIFDTKLELLKKYPPVNAARAVNGGSLANQSVGNKGLKSTCVVKGAGKYDVCGALFYLSEDAEKGYDFSDFDYVSIDIQANAPVPSHKIKFTFRNFNPQYSKPGQLDSTKYNSILFSKEELSASKKIALDKFHVESWWVREFDIDFENAHVDFSNVFAINVINNDIQSDGQYSLLVKSVTLYGTMISLPSLLSIVAGVWLLLIVLLVMRNRVDLHNRACKDYLTGISNRNGMMEWVKSLRLSPSNQVDVTMFYMDIDDFKQVNDTLGHQAGDAILKHFCKCLKQVLSEARFTEAKFIRLSGDEFAVFASDIDQQQAEAFATSIYNAFSVPANIESKSIFVKVSMGIASQKLDSSNIDILAEHADMAMYVAKDKGKNQFKVYDEQVQATVTNRKQIARALQKSIEQDMFELLFMPIFDIKTQRVKNVEVLLRATSPELAHLGPREFIPIAEEFGVIQQLDMWVMERTFKQINANRDLIEGLGLCFCINVSTFDLHDMAFCESVFKLMHDCSIEGHQFCLEVAETAFEKTSTHAIECLSYLQQTGVHLVLDDFGTGYTALNQLINYPIDGIKVDKTFTDLLLTNKEKAVTLIRSIILIAEEYGLSVTAEGVETIEQFEFLQNEGCQFIQGYLYCEPLTFDELSRGLKNQDKFFASINS